MAHYVLICGGRDFDDRERVFGVVEFLSRFYGTELRIMHGGARGADSLAGEAAEMLGIKYRVFPADWNQHGKAAGSIRNAEMRAYLEMCRSKGHTVQVMAFPGGNGTRDMVNRAESVEITVDHV